MAMDEEAEAVVGTTLVYGFSRERQLRGFHDLRKPCLVGERVPGITGTCGWMK